MFARGNDREDGFALIAVMGAVALITVVAIAGFLVAEQSTQDSTRTSGEEKAYQAASSGLEVTFGTDGFTDLAGASPQPRVVVNGTDSYQVTIHSSAEDNSLHSGEYEVISVGTSGNSLETVRQRAYVWDLWRMNIAGANGGSMNGASGNSGFNGQSTITGPFYTKGAFKVGSGSSSYYDFSGGPLFVYNGSVTDWGGTSGPGDLYDNNPADTVPSGVTLHNDPPDIELPWISEAKKTTYYNNALLQSTDNKLGDTSTIITEPASYPAVRAQGLNPAPYKYVGASTGPAALALGTTNLTLGATSFGRSPGMGYPATSTAHDDFAYNAVTDNLYVEGTVFIDGDLTIGASTTYHGNGTLFVNGQVIFSGDFLPPGGGNGSVNSTNCVGIVTPYASAGGNSDPAVDIGGNTVHCAIFTNGLLGLQHGGTFVGAALTGGIAAIGSGATHITVTLDPAVSSNLPSGMPARGKNVPSREAWRRN